MSLIPETDRRLHVAFLYMKGRVARLPDVAAGRAPTEFFYGSLEMEKQGHRISHFEIEPEDSQELAERVVGRLWPAAARPVKMTPSVLVQAYRLAPQLNRADCLVATGGNIAYALAALKLLGVIRRPIVGIQCGVLNFRHGYWRRSLSGMLLRRMHTLLFGDAELEPMRKYFDLPPEVISVNLFGVDARFWRLAPAVTRDLVLAVGNDNRRDFETLVQAAASIDAPVHIVTKLPLPESLPPNVIHHRGSWHGMELSDERVRELYQRARVVVVPLHPSGQPSGQSVTLQAMACGSPVLLTETEGLWSREQMINERNVFLMPGGDSAALSAGVRRILSDAALSERLSHAGREMVEKRGNIETFAAGLARQCQRSVTAFRDSRADQVSPNSPPSSPFHA